MAMAFIHAGNEPVGYTAPLGKYSTVFSTPKIARGTSGSLTRTMIRNIMLMSASAVATTTMNIFIIRSGFNGSGIPAMTEPSEIKTTPAMIALSAPASVKPRISSNLRMGVTR